MGHRVEDDIDAHGVGVFVRVFAEVLDVLSFALPAVDEIVVVAEDGHHATFFIKQSVVMRIRIAFSAGMRVVGQSLRPNVDGHGLRFVGAGRKRCERSGGPAPVPEVPNRETPS